MRVDKTIWDFYDILLSLETLVLNFFPLVCPPPPRFDAPGCFPINTQVSGDIVTVYAEMDRSNSFKNHFPKNVDTVSSRKMS
jgi:hypothetical protein